VRRSELANAASRNECTTFPRSELAFCRETELSHTAQPTPRFDREVELWHMRNLGLAGLMPAAGETVACYQSFGSEPPTRQLLCDLVARGLGLLLPAPGASLRELRWGRATAATCALPVAPPGQLPSPQPPYLPATALSQCSLVMVPALGVDRSGTRLGRGGGWYDRALAHRRSGSVVLAVVYPFEVHPAGTLPRESHDLSVDGVLTAGGVELFEQNRANGNCPDGEQTVGTWPA